MENAITYLVSFDFHPIRLKFNVNEEWKHQYAVEYFEELIEVSDILRSAFPNYVIDISICTFMMKSMLNAEELKLKIIKEISRYYKPDDNINRQIFIAQIDTLNSFAPRNKQYEIEYILNISRSI